MKITWTCIHELFGHVVVATMEVAGNRPVVLRAPVGELTGLKPETQRLIVATGIERLTSCIHQRGV